MPNDNHNQSMAYGDQIRFGVCSRIKENLNFFGEIYLDLSSSPPIIEDGYSFYDGASVRNDILSERYWLFRIIAAIHDTLDEFEFSDQNENIILCGIYAPLLQDLHSEVSLISDQREELYLYPYDLLQAISYADAWLEEQSAEEGPFIGQKASDRPDTAPSTALQQTIDRLRNTAGLCVEFVKDHLDPIALHLAGLYQPTALPKWNEYRLACQKLKTVTTGRNFLPFLNSDECHLDICHNENDISEAFLKHVHMEWHGYLYDENYGHDVIDFKNWISTFDPKFFEFNYAKTDLSYPLESIHAIWPFIKGDPSPLVVNCLLFARAVDRGIEELADETKAKCFLKGDANNPAFVEAHLWYLNWIDKIMPSEFEDDLWASSRNILENKGIVAAASSWLFGLLTDGDLQTVDMTAKLSGANGPRFIAAWLKSLGDLSDAISVLDAAWVGMLTLQYSPRIVSGEIVPLLLANVPDDAIPHITLLLMEVSDSGFSEFVAGFSLITQEIVPEEFGLEIAEVLNGRMTN